MSEARPADVLAPVRLEVTQERIDRYADLSGDYTPLHVDPEFGRRTEFGSTIAHGPVCAALFFDVIHSWLGTGWAEGVEIQAVFLAPVRSGDMVEARGSLAPPSGHESEARIVQLVCTKADGEIAISGTASVMPTSNASVMPKPSEGGASR